MKDINHIIITINEGFIKIIIVSLLIMTMVMIAISVIELATALVIKFENLNLATNSENLTNTRNLHNVFGLLLSVLIGIELMETVKMYLIKNVFHVEVVITVAMIAIARHIIDMNLVETPGLNLLGTGVLVFSLTGGYFLIKRVQLRKDDSTEKSAPVKPSDII